MTMTHRLSLLTVLSAALVLSACGGSADEGTGSKAAAVCQPDGDWTLSYASQDAKPGCGAPGSEMIRIDTSDAEHPVHLLMGDGSEQPVTSNFDADTCSVSADWSYSYEAGGEPQGSSDSLLLTFVSKNAASGTLNHSAWWWCGMHGQGMFDADAARATP